MEAEEGEYHPEEHIFWDAANRIEDLHSMIDGEDLLDDAMLLRRIADRITEREIWGPKIHDEVDTT
jgi:hypothetical protein